MATRFRLRQTTTAPAVSPTLQAYTHNAPTTVRRQLLTTDSSALTSTAYTPDGADHGTAGDSLWCQFVSDGMQAGKAFTNGDALTLALQGFEAHANNNLNLQLYVAVVDSAGTTVRRVLRSKVEHGTEFGTSLLSFVLATTQDGATYTTVANDRLVVEISVEGTPGGGGGVQGHNGTFRFGSDGAGGDITADGQSGTTLNPWFEVVPNVFQADTTVTPSTASLTTTSFAPTVSTTANQSVTPTTASLSTATFAPTVTTPRLATPATASLTLTTFAPTVTALQGTIVTPGTASLSTATFAPTVSATAHQVVTPSTAGLTTSTFAPSVTATDHQLVTPSTAVLSLSTFTPTVVATDPKLVTPGVASLSLTGFAPNIYAGTTVVTGAAVLSLTTFAPSVAFTDNRLVTPAAATLALTTFAASVLAPRTVTPGALALATVTFAPTITISTPGSVTAIPDVAVLTLTGYRPMIQVAFRGINASIGPLSSINSSISNGTALSAGISSTREFGAEIDLTGDV